MGWVKSGGRGGQSGPKRDKFDLLNEASILLKETSILLV